MKSMFDQQEDDVTEELSFAESLLKIERLNIDEKLREEILGIIKPRLHHSWAAGCCWGMRFNEGKR